MIKGVIFDLGSTLVKFNGDWAEVVYEGATATADWYFKKRHVKVDREALIEAILAERRVAFQDARKSLQEAQMADILCRALRSTGASQRAEGMIDEALRAFFAPEEAAHTPFPDAADTLKSLRGMKLKVGILSNAPNDALIQRMVNDNGLRAWASPVFSSAGLGWRKPMPEPFAIIAKRWQLPHNQIVVVGDTLSADILGAKNAGMHSILARMTENSTNDQYRHIRPDRTVDVLAQIPAVIESIK